MEWNIQFFFSVSRCYIPFFAWKKNLFLSNASILTVAGLLIYSQPLCNTRVGRKWKNSELGVCVYGDKGGPNGCSFGKPVAWVRGWYCKSMSESADRKQTCPESWGRERGNTCATTVLYITRNTSMRKTLLPFRCTAPGWIKLFLTIGDMFDHSI